MVGIISNYRSGKHWLLAGIFDTLNVYPERYLDFVAKDYIPATAKGTNNYKININNIDFMCLHERKHPYSNTDRFIVLDRKDRKAQAISLINSLQSGIHAAYSDIGVRLVRTRSKIIPKSKSHINETIKFLDSHKKEVLESLHDAVYMELWYEDLLDNYEFHVKDVIEFLFNIKVDTILYKYTPHKLRCS